MAGANFFPTRGCVYTVPVAGSRGGSGLYRLDGITDQKGDGSAILVTGIDMRDSDVVAPVLTTEDLRILYVFGKSFGSVVVHGEILLGSADSTPGKLSKIQSWFQQKRVAVSKKPVQLSIASKAYNVYVKDLILGAADNEFNIQSFGIEGIIAN